MNSHFINQRIRSRKGGLVILLIGSIFMYSVFFLSPSNEKKFDQDTIIEHIQKQVNDETIMNSDNYPYIDSESLVLAWNDGKWHSEWDSVRNRWIVKCSYEYDASTYVSRWLTLDDGSIVDSDYFITE